MATPPPPRRQALGCLLSALCAGLGLSSASLAQTIATGARHALALQSDGSMLAWGDNRLAQLGQGKTVYASTGLRLYIGYERDADEMRTSRRFREVLKLLPDVIGMALAVDY